MAIKEQKTTISVSAIVSVVGALGTVWAFAGPIAQSALSAEVTKQITKQVKPLADSFEILMTTNVRNLRNSIAAMEFKRDMCTGDPCWTIRDAQDLTAARAELVAAEQALASIRASKEK